MSTTLLATVLLQVVMVVLLRHRLGPRWLRRPVTVLVLASVVELGVGPLLLKIPSIGSQDTYRRGIQPGFIDSADLIMSAAMLALTVMYLVTAPERVVPPERPTDPVLAARVLDWRLLGGACIPLTLITGAGHGYNDGKATGPHTSLLGSLVAAFFIVLIVTAAAAFLMRHGTRWFFPVLIVQSLLLAVAGERTPVLMDAIALILMLLFAGLRIPGRQLAAGVALTAVVILAISGVRVQQTRNLYYTNSGVSTRVSALATGLSAPGAAPGAPGAGTDALGLVCQFAVRVSAVDFGGAILQSISLGQPRLSPVYVPDSLLLAVPSFVWPTKISSGTALEPALVQTTTFGLQPINFIPGMPGLYIGFLATPWLAAFFGLLGLLFGWFERWLLRECTPARLVLLGGAVTAALWFEAGLPTIVVQLRSAAVLALAVYVIGVLQVSGRPKEVALTAGLPDCRVPARERARADR